MGDARVLVFVTKRSWVTGYYVSRYMRLDIVRCLPHYRLYEVNALKHRIIAGWSSLVARWAHNPKVVGSNPAPATI
jgi:hypothetical protein